MKVYSSWFILLGLFFFFVLPPSFFPFFFFFYGKSRRRIESISVESRPIVSEENSARLQSDKSLSTLFDGIGTDFRCDSHAIRRFVHEFLSE
jgi:hypothetical protein